MKMRTLGVLLVVSAMGCASPEAQPEPRADQSEQDSGSAYAEALKEAFEVYADEVYSAALFDYTSLPEAEAVVRTLSGRHFDHLLEQALARRGLTVQGLAHFAETHPAFFHEQQRLHWGKLQELEAVLASIPAKVKPVAVDDTLAAM
jgi:hypothetical protein